MALGLFSFRASAGMNGLEDIPRVGRILRTPGAHPNLKEEPCGGSRRRRSEALLAVQRSCPPLKKLDGGRASPPVQVRALACFQIPLPPPRTTWGQPPPAVRRSAAPLAVRTLLPAISKKTSVEDGRPRPSRFEHSRASQIPSPTTDHVEADASGRRIVSEPPSAIRPQTGETPFKSTENPA